MAILFCYSFLVLRRGRVQFPSGGSCERKVGAEKDRISNVEVEVESWEVCQGLDKDSIICFVWSSWSFEGEEREREGWCVAAQFV